MTESKDRTTDKPNGKNLMAAALQQKLDPTRPAFHLVPAAALADTMKILQKLPYEDVYRVLPQLAGSQLIQPDEEGKK